MTPRYLNLFLDVRLATFHLSPRILTPKLPYVTCGLIRKNVIMVINYNTDSALNGVVIDRVSNYKLLGVVISDDLS